MALWAITRLRKCHTITHTQSVYSKRYLSFGYKLTLDFNLGETKNNYQEVCPHLSYGRVSFQSLGWNGTHFVEQLDLEFIASYLCQPPEFQDCRHELPYKYSFVDFHCAILEMITWEPMQCFLKRITVIPLNPEMLLSIPQFLNLVYLTLKPSPPPQSPEEYSV